MEQALLHGKEVFNFFTVYQIEGIISIFIFGCLTFFTIYKILNIRYQKNIACYSDFLIYITNRYSFLSHTLFLFFINLFLMICFYIMISALSTLFFYQFGVEKTLVTLAIIFICYFIFRQENLNFIYFINFILMPILILFILCLGYNTIHLETLNFTFSTQLLKAILYGVLYFSYNSLLMVPVLFHIKIKNKKNNFILSFLFSFIIFILTLLINLLLLSHFNLIENTELPVFTICILQQNMFPFFYFFIILSAILTTLFSSGFSFMQNIKKHRKCMLIIFLLCSILFSFISFSHLITIFYPLFGLLGLLQIFLIFIDKY